MAGYRNTDTGWARPEREAPEAGHEFEEALQKFMRSPPIPKEAGRPERKQRDRQP